MLKTYLERRWGVDGPWIKQRTSNMATENILCILRNIFCSYLLVINFSFHSSIKGNTCTSLFTCMKFYYTLQTKFGRILESPCPSTCPSNHLSLEAILTKSYHILIERHWKFFLHTFTLYHWANSNSFQQRYIPVHSCREHILIGS